MSSITCPHCRHRGRISADPTGKHVRCPRCHKAFAGPAPLPDWVREHQARPDPERPPQSAPGHRRRMVWLAIGGVLMLLAAIGAATRDDSPREVRRPARQDLDPVPRRHYQPRLPASESLEDAYDRVNGAFSGAAP